MNPAIPDFSRIPMNASEVLTVARHLGIDTPTVKTFRNGSRLVSVTLPGWPCRAVIRLNALASRDGREACSACDALHDPAAMIATPAGHYCAHCAPTKETA